MEEALLHLELYNNCYFSVRRDPYEFTKPSQVQFNSSNTDNLFE